MLDFSAGQSKNLPLNALIGGLTSADNTRLITVCAEGIVSSLWEKRGSRPIYVVLVSFTWGFKSRVTNAPKRSYSDTINGDSSSVKTSWRGVRTGTLASYAKAKSASARLSTTKNGLIATSTSIVQPLHDAIPVTTGKMGSVSKGQRDWDSQIQRRGKLNRRRRSFKGKKSRMSGRWGQRKEKKNWKEKVRVILK